VSVKQKYQSCTFNIAHPAFNVVKFGVPEFVEQYQRIYSRTKIKMKGYVAVQRLIYTLWKNKEDLTKIVLQ
jgi:hypothetical protein